MIIYLVNNIDFVVSSDGQIKRENMRVWVTRNEADGKRNYNFKNTFPVHDTLEENEKCFCIWEYGTQKRQSWV